MELLSNAKFNFIGNRKTAFIISGILILVTFISLVLNGGPNLSIDFSGGTALQLKFINKDISAQLPEVKALLGSLDMGIPEVKLIGEPDATGSEIQIIIKKKEDGTAVGDRVKSSISEKFPELAFELRREEKVGPKIGKELQGNAIWAVLLSLLVIVAYIGIRFRFSYGIAAIVALFHDVIITVGVFSILGWEISLPIVAAILTIVGYSLNDTIVVFDRIRENMARANKDHSKESFEDKINDSINQTLSRTIITSLTTFVVVATIFFFFINTADVLKYFSGALIVGIISGTYSSVFIASPVLVAWNRKWPIEKH
jgi:preprotein translocase SecF subunit